MRDFYHHNIRVRESCLHLPQINPADRAARGKEHLMTDEKQGKERVMLTTDQVVAALDVRNRVAGVIQEEGGVLSSSAREAAEALIRIGYLDVHQVEKGIA